MYIRFLVILKFQNIGYIKNNLTHNQRFSHLPVWSFTKNYISIKYKDNDKFWKLYINKNT